MTQSRLEQQLAFVETHGWSKADLFPLPSDASNRSYTRLIMGGESRLLMDAPPETEKLPEYLRIAAHLKSLGLKAPEVFASDLAAGLALIEDFGRDTFTSLLRAGQSEEKLYLRAADVLAHLRSAGTEAIETKAPPYDMDLLLEEVGRFLLWFVPAARGDKATAEETECFFAAWRGVLKYVEGQRNSFVFRDFHVDNLMVVPCGRGVLGCGLLDFQDALTGAAAYDMVSLLEDARRDVSVETRKAVLEHYFKLCPDVDRQAFVQDMAVLGAQRHTKVAGLFVRLSVQDNKHIYLEHLPRVMRLLQQALAEPSLAPVRVVVENIVPDFSDPELALTMRRSLEQPSFKPPELI